MSISENPEKSQKIRKNPEKSEIFSDFLKIFQKIRNLIYLICVLRRFTSGCDADPPLPQPRGRLPSLLRTISTCNGCEAALCASQGVSTSNGRTSNGRVASSSPAARTVSFQVLVRPLLVLTPCEAQRAALQPLQVEIVRNKLGKRPRGWGRGGSASRLVVKRRKRRQIR